MFQQPNQQLVSGAPANVSQPRPHVPMNELRVGESRFEHYRPSSNDNVLPGSALASGLKHAEGHAPGAAGPSPSPSVER